MNYKIITLCTILLFMICNSAKAALKIYDEDIPIPINPGEVENNNIFRKPNIIPFECYYSEINGHLSIYCLTTINDLNIEIENVTTGETILDNIVPAAGSIFIPLNGSGFYHLKLTINNNQYFIGNFIIE